jgi:membrane protease YdiL (CAAX protease family)
MSPGDAYDAERLTAPGDAAAILRPALVLWLVVSAIGGVTGLVFAYAGDRLSDRALVVVLALASVADAAVIARFAMRDRETCRLFVVPRRGMVELCLLAGITGGMALAWWGRTIPSYGPDVIEMERASGVPWWGSLLLTAAMPALFEELMFRGVILHRLALVIPVQLAVAVQAMLFALVHFDGLQLLPLFAFGCLAAFLRLAAGALWPCILMHFVWNGWAVLQRYDLL